MKKTYRFNLIPGVEFIEDDGFYYAASDDPIWPKSHIIKVVIEGLIEYEKNNANLYDRLEFTKKCVENRDKAIEEKDKEIKTHKNAVSVLNGRIEFIKKCAENEIDHRNKLLDEKDKEIEYLREKNSKLNKQIAESPITKSPIPLSSASDCSDFYICSPDHIAYGPIAGEFGIGLYVGDTLILLKGDKASEVVHERSSMTDKINALKATLKKKDGTIEKLRNDVEFANNMCDGYGALADTLMGTIVERNSEIKVLSDQVTRLMDQLKEANGENPGCKSCSNGPKPCCDICGNIDCEHRVETEAKSETNSSKALRSMVISALDIWLKNNSGCGDINPCRLTPEMVAEYERKTEKETKPETNFDKIMAAIHSELAPARLAEMIKTSECAGISCKDCLFNSIAEPGHLSICDMPLGMLTKWLEENIKKD